VTAAQGFFCNPSDLAYRYPDVRFSGTVNGIKVGEPRRSVHREAADPSIVQYRGRHYMLASMSLSRSVDLLPDDFVEVTSGSFPFWDPDLFQDTDGSVYPYWGCGSRTPIHGVRLSDIFRPSASRSR